MLGKPPFVVSSPLKAQIDPHWLFDSHVANVHEKRIGQNTLDDTPIQEKVSACLED
jgi:hypothetical protein